MPKQTHDTKLNRYFCITILFIIFSGCTTVAEKQESWFDPTTVAAMLFDYDYPDDFFGSSLAGQGVSTKVSNNLSGWNYDISISDAPAIGHVMWVEIGKIKRGSTPAGLSFSLGNSDPRALDFQKADVMPISCFLSPKSQPDKSAEMTMLVEAKDYLKYQKNTAKLTELLVDDLSTVCFNLLSNLSIKTMTPKVTGIVKSPRWIPEIRIEVIDEDEEKEQTEVLQTIPKEKSLQPSIKYYTNQPTPDTQQKIKSNPDKIPSIVIEEITAEKKEPTLSDKKRRLIINEPRKRVIIHNQGSPVIFKFGHERK